MTRGASILGILVILILIFLGLGLVWYATGGPSRPISHSGIFLTRPTAPNVAITGYGSTSGSGENLTPVNSTPATSVTPQSEKEPTILDHFFNYRRGSAVGNADSPYASYISLRRGDTDTEKPDKEYVVITVSRSLPSTLTLSDWTIESTVYALRIPLGQAAQIPYLGQVNTAVPITAHPESALYVVTGRAPNGTSFRVNKCTGYFEQFQDFTPYLRNECPSSENEALLSPEKVASNALCIDFVERLSSCQLYTGSIPLEIGNLCRDFIVNDLTYAGCVARHKGDPDFYKNEWRVYLNRNQEMWAKAHDQILLRDENGKLVAEISY